MPSLRFLTTNLVETVATLMNGPAVVTGAINSCDGTPGSPSITRVTGSYVTDGVKPGALLSGAIAARFPANTYVLTVTALTLTMNANATSDGTNEAATFTPYEVLDEVSPRVMTNMLTHDRTNIIWQQSSGGAMQVHLDLGADRAVTVMGLAGLRSIAGAVTTCVIRSSAEANGYPPAAGSSWTTRATLNSPGVPVPGLYTSNPNAGAIISSISARWWEFDFSSVSGAFTLAKPFLGVFDYDLGVLYSRGAQIVRLSPMFEERSVGKDPVRTYVGHDRELWAIPYRDVLNALVAKLEALRFSRTSFLCALKDDSFREFIVQGGQLARTLNHEQASDTVQDAQFDLEEVA